MQKNSGSVRVASSQLRVGNPASLLFRCPVYLINFSPMMDVLIGPEGEWERERGKRGEGNEEVDALE